MRFASSAIVMATVLLVCRPNASVADAQGGIRIIPNVWDDAAIADCHDGSVASLEEMFNPDRLKETHVAGGWMPLGAKSHAIQGHKFGLGSKEREQLIAFLRIL
jgi:hypothetical protein